MTFSNDIFQARKTRVKQQVKQCAQNYCAKFQEAGYLHHRWRQAEQGTGIVQGALGLSERF